MKETADWYRERGDDRAAASLAVPLSIALSGTGEDERAIALLSDARKTMAQTPGPELVSILAAQAWWALNDNHFDLAQELVDEAMGLAGSLGLALPLRLLRARGALRLMRGDAGGAEDLREVIEAGFAAGDLGAAEGALYSLGFYENDNEASIARYDEAIAFGSAHGLSTIGAHVGRVGTLFAAGRWDEVMVEGKALRTSADLRGDSASVWIVDFHINMIRIERGENIGRQDELVVGARDHGFPMIYVAPLAAEAALADGVTEIARQLLVEALDATAPGEVDFIAHFVRAALRGHAPELAQPCPRSGDFNEPDE